MAGDGVEEVGGGGGGGDQEVLAAEGWGAGGVADHQVHGAIWAFHSCVDYVLAAGVFDEEEPRVCSELLTRRRSSRKSTRRAFHKSRIVRQAIP